MESLQQVWIDLVGRLREMPRGTQVLIAVVAVFCVLLVTFFNGGSSSRSQVDLLPGVSLSARQLPAYEMAFAEAGLEDHRIEQQTIWVPRAKKAHYMAALSTAKLLNPTSGKIVEEALDASSPFENQQQRSHRIKIARQRELAQRIIQFKGIEEATVEYDSVVKKGLQRQTECTASVTVRAINNQRLSIAQAQVIRKYLAGCIAGLDSDNVYIVDLNLSAEDSVVLGSVGTSPRNVTHNATTETYYHEAAQKPKTSLPTGTIAILGSALIAGCVALWRRKKATADVAELPISSFEMDISESEESATQDTTTTDTTTTDTTNSIASDAQTSGDNDFKEFVEDRGGSKQRLLLAGQSDYSHLVPDQQTDGIELTTLTIDSPKCSNAAENSNSKNRNRPFEFVHEANPDDLFEILRDESPQIIATVFSHLQPDQSAPVLNRLSHEIQLEVLKNLSDLNTPNEELAREIGKTLADRLNSLVARNEKCKAGLQAVNDLLRHVNQSQRTELLHRLHKQDADFAQRLDSSAESYPDSQSATTHNKRTERQKTFQRQSASQGVPHNMLLLSGEELCEVFAAADPHDAILALSNWDAQITERLTSNMLPEEALRLQKKLHNTKEPQQREISARCNRVLEIATRLEESGKIRFG